MDLAGAAIAGVSAIGGGMVVAVSNDWIRRADSKERTRTELLAAIVGYLHMLELIGLEAARQPKSGRMIKALNRFIEEQTPQIDYTTGRLHEAIFTPHLRSLMDRYSFASNRLLMVAPIDLLERMQVVSDLLAEFEGPDPGWSQRWRDAHASLVRACRLEVGPEAKIGAEVSTRPH
jgi:hypothetical protein